MSREKRVALQYAHQHITQAADELSKAKGFAALLESLTEADGESQALHNQTTRLFELVYALDVQLYARGIHEK